MNDHSTTGFNLVGYFTSNIGLGVAARSLAKIIEQRGFRYCINNVESKGMARCRDIDYLPFLDKFSQKPLYDINIFIFGVDFAKHIYPRIVDSTEMRNKYNVLVPYWELFDYPDELISLKHRIQAFLAPSRFIQYSLMRVLDQTSIEYMPQCPDVDPDDFTAPKSSDGTFRFFFNFDVNSTIQRKNPDCLLNAFSEAFGDDDNVELVLKVNNTNNPAAGAAVRKLREHAATRRVRLISGVLSYREMLELIRSMDCYVSTHRSEGLGLGLFEAMALGVPCIATGYGGNTDFMSNSNSILLNYRHTDVNSSHYLKILGRNSSWAEPDYWALVRAMRRIRHDDDFRYQIVAKGREDATAHMKQARKGAALDAVVNAYAFHRSDTRLALERLADT